MTGTIKLLFASGSPDRVPTAIEHMRKLFPELPLVVVSEFPVADVHWIPYPAARGIWENLALFRWHFRGSRIRLCAVIWQPRTPHRRMRLIAFLLAPGNFLSFTERFGPIGLRPRSLPTIARHLLWRTKLEVVSGCVRFCKWLAQPRLFEWLSRALGAWTAGAAITVLRALLPRRARAPFPAKARPHGISVVIPSRDGRHLLAALLPEAVRQIDQAGGEVIVVDNGSSDGTAGFLAQAYPQVEREVCPTALSFARAVNIGIRKARFSHVCLLNNDMAVGEGFFEALRAAFGAVPDLFCATAQIFFPANSRREETGKAVMPFPKERNPSDFPLRCDPPLPGEDLSYVLYGSGGCSMFLAEKLLALGGLDEGYQPAYVEDLDLGFRAWQQGWPSVFMAGAHVVHQHRATMSRYYSREFLERTMELHYLRFLARTIDSPRVFWRLWAAAVRRLNALSAAGAPAARAAFSEAWRAPLWLTRRPAARLAEDHILALGSGAVSVVPGRPRRHRSVVLVATPYLPFPLAHGGAVRMFNLMRRAARDFDQVLVSFTSEPGEVPAELLDICSEVVLVKRLGTHLLPSTRRPEAVEEYDSPAFRAALRQTIRKWKPEVVQLEFTQMAQYAADCSPAQTILVEHDVTFDLYQQLLVQDNDWELRRQLQRWISFETAAWRQVDRVVTMSEKDREMTRSAGLSPARAVCLPNGVDLERFRPSGRHPEPRRLLFIGSFAHLPNVLAVEFFLREAWPLLQPRGATLNIIAGARARYHLDRFQNRVRIDLAQPGLEVENFVADVRPAYERAEIVVAPLLASAGTNIKIMEAMAMGKAIVSTPAGINGLDLYAGKEVIVASTGATISHAILDLFENPVRRHSVERQARRAVESRFDWEAIARRQKLLYEELTGASDEYRAALLESPLSATSSPARQKTGHPA